MVAPDGQESRGQSETVGIVLLTGVVAIVALSVGAVIVTQTADSSEDRPRIDFVVDAAVHNLQLTHNGGESVEIADIDVFLRTDSDDTELELGVRRVSDGDDDGRFEPSERLDLSHCTLSDRGTVLIVHEPTGTIVSEARESIDGVPICAQNPVAENADGDGTKAALNFELTNNADGDRRIVDMKITATAGERLYESGGPEDYENEIYIDTSLASDDGEADKPYGGKYAFGTKVVEDGFETDGTLATTLPQGETATVYLFQFQDGDGNEIDLTKHAVEVTLYLENGETITFRLTP